MMVTQGKRSSALGRGLKIRTLLGFWFAAPACAANQKGRSNVGVRFPGRQSLRSFALGYFLPPLRGLGAFSRVELPADRASPDKRGSR